MVKKSLILLFVVFSFFLFCSGRKRKTPRIKAPLIYYQQLSKENIKINMLESETKIDFKKLNDEILSGGKAELGIEMDKYWKLAYEQKYIWKMNKAENSAESFSTKNFIYTRSKEYKGAELSKEFDFEQEFKKRPYSKTVGFPGVMDYNDFYNKYWIPVLSENKKYLIIRMVDSNIGAPSKGDYIEYLLYFKSSH